MIALLVQVNQATLGNHGLDVQFAGINFLEYLVKRTQQKMSFFLQYSCDGFEFLLLLVTKLSFSKVSEFSPSTSSALRLPREFHELCRKSLELDYLKVC